MKNFRKRKWRFRLQFDRLLYILLIKPKSGHEESCIQDVLNTLIHKIVRGSTLPDCPSSGFRSSRFRRTEKTDASCGKGCHPLAEEPVHVLLISFCRDAHEDTREMRKTPQRASQWSIQVYLEGKILKKNSLPPYHGTEKGNSWKHSKKSDNT